MFVSFMILYRAGTDGICLNICLGSWVAAGHEDWDDVQDYVHICHLPESEVLCASWYTSFSKKVV